MLAEQPEHAVINDANEQLVNVYEQIKCNPEFIIDALKAYDSVLCSRELYLEMRQKYNRKIADGILDTEGAALFIALNHRAFNGVYRVNKSGDFNVPWNNRQNINSFDENNIRNISAYLQEKDITIKSGDFYTACKSAEKGDFVFLDPPYIPVSKTADFTNYTKNGFRYADQCRTAKLFKELDEKGVTVISCNSNVEQVKELYRGYNIEEVSFRTSVSAYGSRRDSTELIISNT